MSQWNILATVELQSHHWPSKTRHTINGVACGAFTRLEIATGEGDSGFFLLHLYSDGRGNDTWHPSLEEAFEQAEFEFGVKEGEWHMRHGRENLD